MGGRLLTEAVAIAAPGHLDLPATVGVGVMLCSPERAGLEATFRDVRVRPPISREGVE